MTLPDMFYLIWHSGFSW